MAGTREPHPFRLGPGICSRYPADELRARLAGVDLVAADIDECLYPGFSQTHLGQTILLQILTRPESRTDLRFVPQLLHGGAYIRKVQLLRRVGRTPSNAELMRRYEHSMWAIPRGYFDAGARGIPTRLFDGVEQTLQLLGRRAPVGLVSFGIQPIADELQRQLNQRAGRSVVTFAEANPIAFAIGGDGRPGFAGYDPAPRTEPREKRQSLERQLRRHGASRPLVLGNGRDEHEMARLARRGNGLSVGFRPVAADASGFDVVVRSRDWRPVARLLGDLGPV